MAEGFTHADAVVGHFRFRPKGRGDIELADDALQLSVVEAKMASLLSSGTSNAPAFNQAARNVACIAHVLATAQRRAQSLQRVSFTIIAPMRRIQDGSFDPILHSTALRECVKQRVEMFSGKYNEWFEQSFSEVLEYCKVAAISWESVVEQIAVVDLAFGIELSEFLEQCLKYNPIRQTRRLVAN